MRIIIEKAARRLSLFYGDKLLRTFDVVLGFSPFGSKEIEGDGKTPEGEYSIAVKNPKSKYHLSLGLNYPNEADAERGLTGGLISRQEFDAIVVALDQGKLPPQNTALGGEIYIHGGGLKGDWTHGCVAADNDEMSELFDKVEVGTKVTITA